MTGWRAVQIVLAGLCLALAHAACADAAVVVQTGMLGQFIFGQPPEDDRNAPAPPVARYVSDQGQTFIFDRSSPTPLLKFDDSGEVLALSPTPAARGDTIYRDDMGQPVLRVTRLGGLTVFFPGRPGGAPVALEGQAPMIRLMPMSPAALLQHLVQDSFRVTHATRHLIMFDAQDPPPGSEALFADSAFVTAQALVKIADEHRGENALARLARVLFEPGAKETVSFSKGVLHVIVNVNQGLAGRPSSARIISVAMKSH